MSLVQFPCLLYRNPCTIRLVHDSEKSLDSASQKGSMSDVSLDSFCFDELSCLGNFLNSLGGERTVIPTSKFILEVPGRLSLEIRQMLDFMLCALIMKMNLNTWTNAGTLHDDLPVTNKDECVLVSNLECWNNTVSIK